MGHVIRQRMGRFHRKAGQDEEREGISYRRPRA